MRLLIPKVVLFALISYGLAISAYGQIEPEVSSKFRSDDAEDRMNAYRLLAARSSRTADEDTALVALLLREEAPNHGSPPGTPDPSSGDDGDYPRYLGALADTVAQIADKNPERTDVWSALVRSPYTPQSEFTRWLATHSDKTAPYFLAAAKGSVPGLPVADQSVALVVLAQIFDYERDPATKHHLGAPDLQAIDRTVRENLNSSDFLMRLQAIISIGIMGMTEDLDMLDLVAATDPYYDHENDRYTFRLMAHIAAEDLRRSLGGKSAQKADK
jgi:hypothetical protein